MNFWLDLVWIGGVDEQYQQPAEFPPLLELETAAAATTTNECMRT